MTEDMFFVKFNQHPCENRCEMCKHFNGGYDYLEGKCRHPERDDNGERYNTFIYNTCDAFERRNESWMQNMKT